MFYREQSALFDLGMRYMAIMVPMYGLGDGRLVVSAGSPAIDFDLFNPIS
jgi:hypothetical protein